MRKTSTVDIGSAENKGWEGFIQVTQKRLLRTTTEIVVELKRESKDRVESQSHKITKERIHDARCDATYTVYGALSLGEYEVVRPVEIGASGRVVKIKAKRGHEEFDSLSGHVDYLSAEKKGCRWEVWEQQNYRKFYAAGTRERDVLRKIDESLGIGLPDYFDKAMKELRSVP
jgi:hypothetical protein